MFVKVTTNKTVTETKFGCTIRIVQKYFLSRLFYFQIKYLQKGSTKISI